MSLSASPMATTSPIPISSSSHIFWRPVALLTPTGVHSTEVASARLSESEEPTESLPNVRSRDTESRWKRSIFTTVQGWPCT